MLRHRSAVGHGSLPCSCPMWIHCQDCSAPARTGVVSGTSATRLTVREKEEKSEDWGYYCGTGDITVGLINSGYLPLLFFFYLYLFSRFSVICKYCFF